MITEFYTFISEKSALTDIGVPTGTMQILQKAHTIGNSPIEQIPSTKKAIKEHLLKYKLILIERGDGDYSTIYFSSRLYNARQYKILSWRDGRLLNNGYSNPITTLLSGLDLKGTKVYSINSYKGFRHPYKIDSERNRKLIDRKIQEFVSYFNNNTRKSISKVYAKKWEELVDAIREYYDRVTKNPKIFLNRVDREANLYSGEKYKKDTMDFSSMAYTLQQLAEKIEEDGAYKIRDGYSDSGYNRINFKNKHISQADLKMIKKFLIENGEIDVSDLEEDNYVEMLLRAIDYYGMMKLTTLYGRYIMKEVSNWLKEKTGHYTGMDDAVDKFNL